VGGEIQKRQVGASFYNKSYLEEEWRPGDDGSFRASSSSPGKCLSHGRPPMTGRC
jgi:hypothetical protein